jgi:hypothetical protein
MAKRSITFPRALESRMSPTRALVKNDVRKSYSICMYMYVEITYPLFVRGAAAKVPARNRKIKMEAVFYDRAQPI